MPAYPQPGTRDAGGTVSKLGKDSDQGARADAQEEPEARKAKGNRVMMRAAGADCGSRFKQLCFLLPVGDKVAYRTGKDPRGTRAAKS